MTDPNVLAAYHTSDAAKRFLRKRHRSEGLFKLFGILAISLAVIALLALMWSIGSSAYRVVNEHYALIETEITLAPDEQARIDDPDPELKPNLITVVKTAMRGEFEGLTRRDRRELYEIVSGDAGLELGAEVKADPSLVGQTRQTRMLLSDDAQLFIKGYFGDLEVEDGNGILSVTGTTGEVEVFVGANAFTDALGSVKTDLIRRSERLRRQSARQQAGIDAMDSRLARPDATAEERVADEAAREGFVSQRDRLAAEAAELERRAAEPSGNEPLNDTLPSYFVYVNGGKIKLTSVSNERATGTVLLPLQGDADAQSGDWQLVRFERPEADRKITDKQALWLDKLRNDGKTESVVNMRLFNAGDSREAELAGIWGGLVGSFWTMLVTFLLAFPIGVLAAIYLEEFAPKNTLTDFIEVNINNLAAIPSIIFGLFGLVVFIGFFGVPRSTPFVGGAVLALMSLPTIIIAARASIRAVPPSIRDAALGLGASKVQTVFHHVLPLAMPGIMTGTIIAMAQALGETAPLIMIGMVGFFADVSTGPTSATTVMPALIYIWSDYPQNLFEAKTAMAIVILLLFLIAMNMFAIFLRKRFERRW
ncbi:MAG: phosphate ABC transporter permease PstA [Pseudomonadota bacterium]